MQFLDSLGPEVRAMSEAFERELRGRGLPVDGFAILEDDLVVPTNGLVASLWAQLRPDACRVGCDRFGSVEISTSFVLVDLNGFRSSPRPRSHFETMTFGLNLPCERYVTVAEARYGHRRTVQLALNKLAR